MRRVCRTQFRLEGSHGVVQRGTRRRRESSGLIGVLMKPYSRTTCFLELRPSVEQVEYIGASALFGDSGDEALPQYG